MRRIYLIRHALPVFSTNDKYCLGSESDNPLSVEGISASEKITGSLSLLQIEKLFSSPLARAYETAQILAGEDKVFIEKDFSELNCGIWDGLSFTQIRSEYPALYRQRGEDPTVRIPGGETLAEGAERGYSALCQIINSTQGNIAVVSHAGLIRAILCKITGTDYKKARNFSVGYLSVTALILDENSFSVEYVGHNPFSLPKVLEYYTKYSTPENVVRHCKKTAEAALLLANHLPDIDIDKELLVCSAYLHDFLRTRKNHALQGARILASDGFLKTALIVSLHHHISPEGHLDESQILFLADKLTLQDSFTTIEKRYRCSEEKCKNSEAMKNLQCSRNCAEIIAANYKKESNLSCESVLFCAYHSDEGTDLDINEFYL